MVNRDVNIILSAADLVLYGSLREEQAFPAILLRAMSFEKPIIAPNLTMVQKYVITDPCMFAVVSELFLIRVCCLSSNIKHFVGGT